MLNYEMTDVADELGAMTGCIGPDAVIDAVGMESHGFGNFAIFDKLKQRGGFGADTPGALREATMACRKGGRVSAPARPLSAKPAPSLALIARTRP